jgi:hypothetical protein
MSRVFVGECGLGGGDFGRKGQKGSSMTIGAHKRYTSYPAKFDSLVVPDVVSVTPSAQIQKMVLTPAGSIHPALAEEVSQDPSVSLTVLDSGPWGASSPGPAITSA